MLTFLSDNLLLLAQYPLGTTSTGLSASCRQSFLLKGTGSVYAAGNNDGIELGIKGQLDDIKLTHVTLLPPNIIDVQAGCYHTLFLTSDHEVYGCGYTRLGQFGKAYEDSFIEPHKLPVTDVTCVAAGYCHSLFLTTSGKVYGCGLNEHQQLVQCDVSRTEYQQELVELSIPTQVPVVAMTAGRNFSLFLDQNGMVHQKGRLTTGEAISLSHQLPDRIVAIKAGYFHALLLTERCEVYGLGLNNCGQLGVQGPEMIEYPTLIPFPEPIIALAAGTRHSLFLTVTGQVYGCGNNEKQQLGGGSKNQILPVLISLPGPVQSMAAGLRHSIFMLQSGELYARGTETG